jgi:hypothetical protein
MIRGRRRHQVVAVLFDRFVLNNFWYEQKIMKPFDTLRQACGAGS